MKTKYIGSRKGYETFELTCTCGYFAELGVRRNSQKAISCPEGCGQLYMARPGNGLFRKPELIAVRNGE